jgi:protein required for attachment to host cells
MSLITSQALMERLASSGWHQHNMEARDRGSNPEFIAGWNKQIKDQRVRKAVGSQAIDLTLLASTPMHGRLTFECAEAVEEKMAKRLRKDLVQRPGVSVKGSTVLSALCFVGRL